MAAIERVKLKQHIINLLLLFTATSVVAFICLSFGSVEISFRQLFDVIFSSEISSKFSTIIFEIRLPRILLAIAVGGGLSVSGAVFQALLMNPLAEPYILGISSGGAFGAVLSFLLGLAFWGTQVFAFSGAIIVVFLVFVLGRRYGELEPNVLLLTGVMIGAFLSALILVMITLLDDSLRSAIYWLMGNISGARMQSVYYVLPISLLISLVLTINAQKYNVLSMGGDNAKHLGVNTEILKNITYILASFMVGAIVSVSGVIGFVGLLIPHVCRMIWGVDNRIIIPASFFVGATYLVIADTIARTIIAPAELPVGAITALIGAPIFIYLLRKRFQMVTF